MIGGRGAVVGEELETVEVETGPQPSRAVIWLHGLGADGHDFEPVVGLFDAGRMPATRFVFPHAPMRPVTINAGYVMRAWYDVLELDFGSRREDAQGIADSARRVAALIARENRRGIADAGIVLAGFSQGGAIALHAGLRHGCRLAGIVALSTYLPLAATLDAEENAANRGQRIFIGHGRGDGVIPCRYGEQTAAMLRRRGHDVDWRDYDADHTVTLEELRDVESWLRDAFAQPDAAG